MYQSHLHFAHRGVPRELVKEEILRNTVTDEDAFRACQDCQQLTSASGGMHVCASCGVKCYGDRSVQHTVKERKQTKAKPQSHNVYTLPHQTIANLRLARQNVHARVLEDGLQPDDVFKQCGWGKWRGLPTTEASVPRGDDVPSDPQYEHLLRAAFDTERRRHEGLADGAAEDDDESYEEWLPLIKEYVSANGDMHICNSCDMGMRRRDAPYRFSQAAGMLLGPKLELSMLENLAIASSIQFCRFVHLSDSGASMETRALNSHVITFRTDPFLPFRRVPEASDDPANITLNADLSQWIQIVITCKAWQHSMLEAHHGPLSVSAKRIVAALRILSTIHVDYRQYYDAVHVTGEALDSFENGIQTQLDAILRKLLEKATYHEGVESTTVPDMAVTELSECQAHNRPRPPGEADLDALHFGAADVVQVDMGETGLAGTELHEELADPPPPDVSTATQRRELPTFADKQRVAEPPQAGLVDPADMLNSGGAAAQ